MSNIQQFLKPEESAEIEALLIARKHHVRRIKLLKDRAYRRMVRARLPSEGAAS
jgi:hypothetical protein